MDEKNIITIEPIEDAKLDELFDILMDDLRRIVRKIGNHLLESLLESSIKQIHSERDRMKSIIRNCQNIPEDVKTLLMEDIETPNSKTTDSSEES